MEKNILNLCFFGLNKIQFAICKLAHHQYLHFTKRVALEIKKNPNEVEKKEAAKCN